MNSFQLSWNHLSYCCRLLLIAPILVSHFAGAPRHHAACELPQLADATLHSPVLPSLVVSWLRLVPGATARFVPRPAFAVQKCEVDFADEKHGSLGKFPFLWPPPELWRPKPFVSWS